MNEWISIKDELPNPEDEFILGHNGSYAFECNFDDGYWCNIGGEEITHWMPLPEPPKG